MEEGVGEAWERRQGRCGEEEAGEMRRLLDMIRIIMCLVGTPGGLTVRVM